KGGMQARAPRLRDARIRDLARQLMLERELTLALHRRAGAMTDEVALLEQSKVGLLASEQLADRAGPEGAAGNRRRLQRRLLTGGEQVHASGDDGVHRVGDLEALGQVDRVPVTVASLEHAAIDQRADQLLEVERIALAALDDEVAQP